MLSQKSADLLETYADVCFALATENSGALETLKSELCSEQICSRLNELADAFDATVPLCSMPPSASIAPMLLFPTSLSSRPVLSALLPKARVEV